MHDPLDTVVWSGNDAEFDLMVEATERATDFEMRSFGFYDGEHECATAGCLLGNLAGALEHQGRDNFGDMSVLACSLGIPMPEQMWLFSESTMSPALCCDSDWWDYRSYPNKPPEKEPNLNRLKKYLAWKRRKAERIELDLAMQAADRELLRRYQQEKRKCPAPHATTPCSNMIARSGVPAAAL